VAQDRERYRVIANTALDIKGGGFLDQLSDFIFSKKKGSAARS
jgi:hypothetical protein